jgi:HEPN domain-containing protein
MDEVRQAALEWIAKAERDLEAAKRMIVCVDPLLDTGSYHCQQAAEKALKGWLTFRSVSVTKTHDLVHLVRQCVKLDIDFQHPTGRARLAKN